jgi:hypothetical protein
VEATTQVGHAIVPVEVMVPPVIGLVVAIEVTPVAAGATKPRVTVLPVTPVAVRTWPVVAAALGSCKVSAPAAG